MNNDLNIAESITAISNTRTFSILYDTLDNMHKVLELGQRRTRKVSDAIQSWVYAYKNLVDSQKEHNSKELIKIFNINARDAEKLDRFLAEFKVRKHKEGSDIK